MISSKTDMEYMKERGKIMILGIILEFIVVSCIIVKILNIKYRDQEHLKKANSLFTALLLIYLLIINTQRDSVISFISSYSIIYIITLIIYIVLIIIETINIMRGKG